ncbi:Aquaporin-1 [Paraconiothyrium brasiliense]|uniref:Aquaporin-1 n=1 Tax=Paraconiothyrium brasiliense TaxID=300254 RepID=A0ABR3QIT2_9PLEO
MSNETTDRKAPPVLRRSATTQSTVPQLSKAGVRVELLHFVGEFVGTFMFLFMAFAGCQIGGSSVSLTANLETDGATPPDASKLLYISFAFGMALAINVWAWAHVSGAMFNPAVTFALTLTKVVPITRAAHVIVAQLLAGICAAAVVAGLLPGASTVSTHLEPTTSIPQGLFLEVFATFQLVIVIFMVAIERNAEPLLAPFAIGLALFVSELGTVFYTGGSLNPARSLGPAVIEGFDGYHWIYWVGPLFGAGIAAALYSGVKALGFSQTRRDGLDAEEWQARS